MNVKGGQMDVWIKSTSWWNNNQRCAAAEAVTIVVLFIISIIWSYTLIHFIQRGSDQINHHVWTSLPANVLTAVNFTLNLFNRLLQNVKISNMCIFTCKKETFQSVLYSNVCPISVMSVIENGSVYFQTHSANAERADRESPVWRDFLLPASWICAAGKYNQKVGRPRQNATGLLTGWGHKLLTVRWNRDEVVRLEHELVVVGVGGGLEREDSRRTKRNIK